MVLPYFLLELGQRLGRLEAEARMPWRFYLPGAACYMDLLAFRSNIKPEALRQTLWLVTHFSTILTADPEHLFVLLTRLACLFAVQVRWHDAFLESLHRMLRPGGGCRRAQ